MRRLLVNLLMVGTAVCAVGSKCRPSELEGLIRSISCADNTFSECLRNTIDVSLNLEDIESCLAISSCTEEDVASLAQDCGIVEPQPDLKKRKAEATSTTKHPATSKAAIKHTTTPAKTTLKPTSKVAVSSTAHSSTKTSNENESKTTSVSSATTDSSSSSSNSDPSSTASMTPDTTTAATTTGTPACSAAGATSTSCPKKSPAMTPSGIAATVILTVGLTSAVIFIVIARLRSKRKQRQRDQSDATELAGGKNPTQDTREAKQYRVGAGSAGDADDAPLVSSGGGRQDQNDQGQRFSFQSQTEVLNSVGPGGQPIPLIQVHELPAEPEPAHSHWSQDYNARR